MLSIVVPMAGRGQRFVDAGHVLPKPLIPIHGRPMISVVVANLTPRAPHRFVFLVRREHLDAHGLGETLAACAPGAAIVPVDAITEGAACTVLLARDILDADEPMMIANCDQYIDADIDAYVDALGDADGLIMTMTAHDPKWSFVRRDETGRVVEVVEKEVVSDEATTGIYNFRRAGDFVAGAEAMIRAEARVRGEFYVAPVYTALAAQGARIVCRGVGRDGAGMHGIGTPADLEAFCASPVSRKAVAAVR